MNLSDPLAIAVSDAAAWDALVCAAPDGHLLQSYRWGEFKARHGWSVERFAVRAGAASAAAQVLWRNTPLGPMGYVARGPAVAPSGDEGALRAVLERMHASARRRRAVYLKLEPNAQAASGLERLGFRRSLENVQPRASLVLDLEEDLDTLKARQHAKTRYNINLARRRGVVVSSGGPEDVAAFSRLMVETGARDGFGVRPEAYYRDALAVLCDGVDLLLATHEGDLLGGLFLAAFNEEAIYLYGASSSHKRNLMANHLLQWEAMRRARERGLRRYDFWGVPPELADAADAASKSADDLPLPREHQRGDLWGVYRFKRGFGGRIVAYAGAFDYVYSGPRYLLWQRLRPLALRLLRRGAD